MTGDGHADNDPTTRVLEERVVVDGHAVAILTLNRASQHNPLDAGTIHALRTRLTAALDDGGLRGVVITGSGPAFSAGGDLKGYQELYRQPDAFEEFMREFHLTCEILERSRLISVAMVNGTCVAGGLELALSCDLITIATDARIGDGHLKFGQLPGAGGSQRLIRAIGAQRARHWMLSAQLFDASEAVQAGLAAAQFPPATLRTQTLALLATVVRHSPLALARMKELIRTADELPLSKGLMEEMRIVHEYASTSFDATEGLRAFADRRAPEYRGE